MTGYVKTVREFLGSDTKDICFELLGSCEDAGQSLIDSWRVLTEDAKRALDAYPLPDDAVVAMEYLLPTDGMSIDLLVAGTDRDGEKKAFIIESKQWNDSFVNSARFCSRRSDGGELHPQLQVSRHALAFKEYLDIGERFDVSPFVFVRNCTFAGIRTLKDRNPLSGATASVPVYNSLETIFSQIASDLSGGMSCDVLLNAKYRPSRTIIQAMRSIVTRQEPFILTAEQSAAVQEVKLAISQGKKAVRITGAAGSGKTAILLNLYVEYSNTPNCPLSPVFVSGAQNTAYYKSAYPEVEGSFAYSYGLKRLITRNNGSNFIVLMDEAQHNDKGIISRLLQCGAVVVLCYDANQTISANNALDELSALEERDDFTDIRLCGSVRFNGSDVAERNIRNYLKGSNETIADENFEFAAFDDFTSFQDKVLQTIRLKPQATVAVVGLLCDDADRFTNAAGSALFTKWGNKSECEWIPYVMQKDYLSKNGGKLWVGTWWMPGLDVDYVAVIVGSDAKRTRDGIKADLSHSKALPHGSQRGGRNEPSRGKEDA